MIGVGLKILLHTPIPKLPGIYTPLTQRQHLLPPKRCIPFKISLKVKFSIIKRIKVYLFLREKDKNLVNENRDNPCPKMMVP